jgi:hypothetical protein
VKGLCERRLETAVWLLQMMNGEPVCLSITFCSGINGVCVG